MYILCMSFVKTRGGREKDYMKSCFSSLRRSGSLFVARGTITEFRQHADNFYAVITVQVMKQNKVRPENKYGTPGPSHGGLVQVVS